MIKSILTSILTLSAVVAIAQSRPTENKVDFELGSGLMLSANDGDYQFNIRGTLQPYYGYQDYELLNDEQFFNTRRAYLSFGGNAVKEKFSFFVQLNFSDPMPLLDAWGAYEPWEGIRFTLGQKQGIANNREMLYMENQLQFADRSLLSTTFSQTGREMGFFFDARLGESVGIVPQVSVTSGDGRNSFGVDSRDVDVGGLKYAARLDVYPLGYFSAGNDNLVADLAHEESFKFVIGGAFSYNSGASNAVGEGHNDFNLYDRLGNNLYPDYRQLYADILMKYKGFSLLGEYSIATATSLKGTYTTVTSDELMPTEISEYLALGNALNVQLGYVTRNGLAFDFRYSDITPEFGENANSLVSPVSAIGGGVSKYFKGNALKVHVGLTSYQYENAQSNVLLGELMLQVMI